MRSTKTQRDVYYKINVESRRLVSQSLFEVTPETKTACYFYNKDSHSRDFKVLN